MRCNNHKKCLTPLWRGQLIPTWIEVDLFVFVKCFTCSWLILVQVPLYPEFCTPFFFSLFTHGCFQLQQDGDTRSRLGPPSTTPSHQPSWLGHGQELLVWPFHYTSNRIPSAPRADHYPRRSSHSDLRTHYAFPSMPQFLWPSSPMPGLSPRVPSPRPSSDLDTQDLELPCIPAQDRPREPRPLPPTWVPTTSSPWLGSLRARCLPKLGPERQPGILVYHLLLPAKHQRQDSFVRHTLPGHPPLPHQSGLFALLWLHQTFLERNCGSALDVHPGHTFSCPTICSQLLRRWPSPTATCTTPTPEEPNPPQASTRTSRSSSHWGPDLSQLLAEQQPAAIDTMPRALHLGLDSPQAQATPDPLHLSRPRPLHRLHSHHRCQLRAHRAHLPSALRAPSQWSLHLHRTHRSGHQFRPWERTRLRWSPYSSSQPPSHSSSQPGTIPRPPDQSTGLPSQLLYTAYPKGVLQGLHQLLVLRQWTICTICWLAAPYPTSEWHLCPAPPKLQWPRIFQYDDVVGTSVSTILTPLGPTGVHRTDIDDSTPHQHCRSRGCHFDQLLLYQDEPGASLGLPDQPWRSRGDNQSLPARMAEFCRRPIPAFHQPKRHTVQIQLQRGIRDFGPSHCKHPGTPKGLGRHRPQHQSWSHFWTPPIPSLRWYDRTSFLGSRWIQAMIDNRLLYSWSYIISFWHPRAKNWHHVADSRWDTTYALGTESHLSIHTHFSLHFHVLTFIFLSHLWFCEWSRTDTFATSLPWYLGLTVPHRHRAIDTRKSRWPSATDTTAEEPKTSDEASTLFTSHRSHKINTTRSHFITKRPHSQFHSLPLDSWCFHFQK